MNESSKMKELKSLKLHQLKLYNADLLTIVSDGKKVHIKRLVKQKLKGESKKESIQWLVDYGYYSYTDE